MSIRRNTVHDMGTVVAIFSKFITLPMYLDVIGAERCGVLKILWTLLGHFGLFASSRASSCS